MKCHKAKAEGKKNPTNPSTYWVIAFRACPCYCICITVMSVVMYFTVVAEARGGWDPGLWESQSGHELPAAGGTVWGLQQDRPHHPVTHWSADIPALTVELQMKQHSITNCLMPVVVRKVFSHLIKKMLSMNPCPYAGVYKRWTLCAWLSVLSVSVPFAF